LVSYRAVRFGRLSDRLCRYSQQHPKAKRC
jgi:hypothetical protein